jgi:hypothetical protein
MAPDEMASLRRACRASRSHSPQGDDLGWIPPWSSERSPRSGDNQGPRRVVTASEATSSSGAQRGFGGCPWGSGDGQELRSICGFRSLVRASHAGKVSGASSVARRESRLVWGPGTSGLEWMRPTRPNYPWHHWRWRDGARYYPKQAFIRLIVGTLGNRCRSLMGRLTPVTGNFTNSPRAGPPASHSRFTIGPRAIKKFLLVYPCINM